MDKVAGAPRWFVLVCVVLCALLAFLITLLCMQQPLRSSDERSSLRCVNLMYNFETPADILKGQAALELLLTPEEYERLKLDNDLRAINAYYKFKYSASRVDPIEYTGDYVLYRLANGNINYYDLWVFLCEPKLNGLKIDDVREYRVVDEKGTMLDEGVGELG